MHIGWPEVILIIVLVIILFGYNKIPGMMKSLAEGVKIFKKEIKSEPANEAPAKKPVAKKVAKKKAK